LIIATVGVLGLTLFGPLGTATEAAAVIEVTPVDGLSFGEVAVGTSQDLNFTVRNVGNGTLRGEASGLTGPVWSFVGSTNYVLGAGETATVTVRFAPAANLPYMQTVAFTGGGGGIAHGNRHRHKRPGHSGDSG